MPRHVFLCQLCDAMKGLQCPLHRTRVTHSMSKDLLVRSQFLAGFNGISFWRGEIGLKANFQVQSDGAGSLGFGIYFRGRWCAGMCPEDWHQNGITRDLTFLEFFPIVGVLWL